MWKRYRFYNKNVEDYRPLISNPKYPWWCDGDGVNAVLIIAYLPIDEDLSKYWNNISHVVFTVEEEIEFTRQFPKPSYFED